MALLAAPAGASMTGDFTRMGIEFWAARNVTACPQPTLILSEKPGGAEDADGAAHLGGCVIELRTRLIIRAARERWRAGYGGDSAREQLCSTVFHELGHTAGLGHTEDGLMGTHGIAVPWDCRMWRVRQDREQRRARHSPLA